MAGPPRQLARSDLAPLAALVAIALALELGAAALGMTKTRLSLPALAVFFDGHLYLQIAKSFPVPYSAQGPAYLGQAPGYPALVALVHALAPGAAGWGLPALLASWIPGALSVGAFYALCKQAGAPPFWGALLFAVANPRFGVVCASAHAEPLAVLLVILCLTAQLRGALGWSAAWLALAALTRFPAVLLSAALAADVLVFRPRRRPREWLWLGVPALALALFNAYLYLRVPGFAGIWEAHRVWWQPRWTWPFAGLVETAHSLAHSWRLPLLQLLIATVAFQLGTIALGFRRSEAPLYLLPACVATIVLFHACLGGTGANDYARLTLLAWPPAALVAWRAASRLPTRAVAAACLVLGGLGLFVAAHQIRIAIYGQLRRQPYLREVIRQLDSDRPQWIDFDAWQGRGTPPAPGRLEPRRGGAPAGGRTG